MSVHARVGWLTLAAAILTLAVWRPWAKDPLPEAPAAGAARPLRIASLTLGTDEILAELVPAERLVCVTSMADDPEISNVFDFYPRHIQRLPVTDPERIIGLNPDLVCVALYNSADFLKVMERSGLPVYRNEAYHSIDEIEAGTIDLGRCVGELDRAKKVVGRMRERRKQLADQLREVVRRPRVLFWSGGFTSGRNTTIDDVIREAAALNVAVEKGLEGPAEISPETVIAADPEFILQSRWSADERESRIENHPLLRNLGAVREDRVITIEARYLTTVSHHVVKAAEALARKLHSDCIPKEGSSPSSAEDKP